MDFNDLKLLHLGNSISIGGIILVGDGKTLLVYFHDADEGLPIEKLEITREQWRDMIRQTDLVETEVLAQAEDGKMMKTVIRKTARSIASGVQWEVFRRDHYRCRYCGEAEKPLTVDHLVLWEEGGPSIPDNLLCACKKCNKTRGNMQYMDWLESPFYKKVSRGLPPIIAENNRLLAATLDRIPRMLHKPSSR